MASVRLMRDEDVEKIFNLEKKIFGSADFEAIKKTLDNDNLNYFVLAEGNSIIGFLEGLIISPDAEIYDIAIDENFQHKGFGTLLMNEFISLAKAKHCETIFLEVNNINTKALTLYEKFGFETYGIRKNYYGDNDAVLMKLDLK